MSLSPHRYAFLRRLLVMMAALVVILTACSGDDDEGSDESGDGNDEQSIQVADSEFVDRTGESALKVDAADNTFEPPYVEIDAGTEVTWENVGRNDHNVTPVDEGSFEGAATEQFLPGDSYSYTFDEPGDYAYYCTIHGTPTRGQRGVIRVVEG